MRCVLQAALDWLFPPQCGGCDTFGTGLCAICAPEKAAHCLRTRTLHVRAVGKYEGALRRAILALKDGRRDVGRAMGLRLACLASAQAQLIPIPTTASRKVVRGFDGAELLAAWCARASGAHVRLLLRQVAGDAQRGRNREERLSARGRFACRAGDLAGREFVLLDDVMTTGSTLEDCARAIRAANGIVNEAIVVAVTERRDAGG